MPADKFFADGPAEVGLDPIKVQALMDRAERDVRDGILPACQVAIARTGKIAAMQTFGRAVQGGAEKPAMNDTVFVAMSATKAITSSALWLLIQEGRIRPADKIVDYVPEYGTNDKASTTIEHLLIHTAGIPTAPGSFRDWGDRRRRLERFAQWRPVNPPGESFAYHIHANYWPIAEALERITGKRLGEFVRERIAEPLGLPDLRIGLPRPIQHRMADVEWVGEPAKDEEYRKLGITPPRANLDSITEDAVLEMNHPDLREMDFPAGGLMTTAGDIALFYQALLNDGRARDGTRIWQSDMLREARRIRSGDLIDPARGIRANRALGIVIAGDDGKANLRGFGRTNSADAFGHPGFGGQMGWADPGTGISFGYLTNGYDRNDLREGTALPQALRKRAARNEARAATELQIDPSARWPKGTVPIVRFDIEPYVRTATYLPDDPTQLRPKTPAPAPDSNNRYYAVWQYAGDVFGPIGRINIWDTSGPSSGDTSIAQTAVHVGQFQSIEAGKIEWAGDGGAAKFFTFFNTNNYATGDWIGGYDTDVDGWVQVSSTVAAPACRSHLGTSRGCR